MTKKKKTVAMPQDKLIPAGIHFHNEDNELTQYLFFKRPGKKIGEQRLELDLPLGKALRGSIIFQRDPDSTNPNRILEAVRVYRKNSERKVETILSTRYSRVNVSRSRVTISMSFPLCDDPQRLKARMQNFANIIIDESDEIAAMLNQEGDAKVQEAWEILSAQAAETSQVLKGGEE